MPMRVGPQTSNRGKPMKLRRRVLNLIKKTQEKYSGSEEERFGPTLPPSTWLMKMGLWSITRRCAAGCWRSTSGVGGKERSTAKRRERKEHFGELVQLDGLKSK